MATFSVERVVDAPPERLWELLIDFGTSPAPEDMKIDLLADGDPDQHGIGALRRVRIAGYTVEERLVGVRPGKAINYALTRGAPVRNYLGLIELIPEGTGTRVRWGVEFTPKIPLTGWLVVRIARTLVAGVLDRLAIAAEAASAAAAEGR